MVTGLTSAEARLDGIGDEFGEIASAFSAYLPSLRRM
jgi:hypothetical protein